MSLLAVGAAVSGQVGLACLPLSSCQEVTQPWSVEISPPGSPSILSTHSILATLESLLRT